MQANIYSPSSILLPPEIIHSNAEMTSLLFGYMEDLCYAPESKSLQIYMDNKILRQDGSRIDNRSEVRFPNDTEKIKILLNEPIPIYYDVFLVNNKLFALGPCLPGLEKIIGTPKLFLVDKKSQKRHQVDGFQQDFIPPSKKKLKLVYSHALSYLVIENLPQDLLSKPQDWQLHFEYSDFSQTTPLRKNPFTLAEKKLTLVSLQKNQPLEQLTIWCNHYTSKHDVKRIIFYNNDAITNNSLTKLPVKNKVELWIVEWNYSFQLRFLSCQVGALTHANWWIKDAANHFINFDPDEFLVNESGISLENYLTKKSPQGLRITGYEIPPNIKLPLQHDSTTRNLAIEQNKSNTKYIFSPNHWHVLFNHSARRYTLLINPAYWTLLNSSSNSIRFFLAKYCYKLIFWPSRILSFWLSMHRPPKNDIYYLHYRALNTQWKWPKSFFKRLEKHSESNNK